MAFSNCLRQWLLIVVTLVFGVSLVATVYGKEEESKIPDVRIIIDISGSMVKNDPKNLRRPALDLLVNLLPDGSRAGVWTFGRYVNMLVKHGDVDENWRLMARQESRSINSLGQFTNLGEAIERSIFDWDSPTNTHQKTIILLTDGMVDISRKREINDEARQKLIDEILPKLIEGNITVHTIALSHNADVDLMKQLALSTDGEFSTVADAEGLLKVFVKNFDNSVETEQVPLKDNRFSVDSGVKEFTALIYREPKSPATRLQLPSGETYSFNERPSNVKWYHDPSYDLVTIKNPQLGGWYVDADIDPGNRVTIVSDLRLKMSKIPNNILLGQQVEFDVYLEEKGALIKRKDFLEIITTRFEQSVSTGESWSAEVNLLDPKNKRQGRSTIRVGKTLTPGEHQFTVLIDGKTFGRKKTQTAQVYDTVLSVKSEILASDETIAKLTVNTLYGFLDNTKTNITLEIVPEFGGSRTVALERMENGAWEYPLTRLKNDGRYQFNFHVEGETHNGRSVSYVHGPEKLSAYFPSSKYKPKVTKMETVSDPVKKKEAPKIEKPEIKVEPKPEPKPEPELNVEPKAETPKEETPNEVEEVEPIVVPPEVELTEKVEEEPSEALPVLEGSEGEEEEGSGNILMFIAGLVGVNGIIFSGVFLLYRRKLKKPKASAENDGDEVEEIQGEELQEEKTPAPKTKKAKKKNKKKAKNK